MSSIDDLLSQVPIDQIAARLGVDPATATQAVNSALPTLLNGLQAEAGDPAGAQSLLGAAQEHHESGVDLASIELPADATPIQGLVGDDTQVQALGGAGGNNELMAKVIPMLAPIVLAYLGKQMMGRTRSGDAGSDRAAPGPASGGALSDILGDLLKGVGGGAPKNTSDILGSVLGGLLGRR